MNWSMLVLIGSVALVLTGFVVREGRNRGYRVVVKLLGVLSFELDADAPAERRRDRPEHGLPPERTSGDRQP